MDPPRPFVLRPPGFERATIPEGGEFALQIHYFSSAPELHQAIKRAIGEWRTAGLGPGRPPVEIVDVSPIQERRIALDPAPQTPQLCVEFITPTELKNLPRPPRDVPFHLLLAAARDRVSTLMNLYGEGSPDLDFRLFAEQAKAITNTSCAIRHRPIARISSRTGQRHGIGGFTGHAEYEGDLARFVPWLHAAAAAGIGRHTVWGNGVIRCV